MSAHAYQPHFLVRRVGTGVKTLFVAGFIAVSPWSMSVAAEALPRVNYADPAALAEAKRGYAVRDPSLKPALNKLLKEAKTSLDFAPVSVMEKQKVPPSGDKHDYFTQAPYFWPNPKTTNGLPYIRKDGERNPESREDSDGVRFVNMCEAVDALALGFYITGEERYAVKAAEILRVFFINPATRMNPNLNYGQGVPGVTTGRNSGLIETRFLVELLDALGLLSASPAWTASDQKTMQAWLADYFDWLGSSTIGREEAAAGNNHGNFYHSQYVAIALFLGRTNVARETLERAVKERIAKHIEPDGRQPLELARTKSLGYSAFNLTALMDLASLGRGAGVDLWHFQTTDGAGIKAALDFLMPYADPDRKWPYPQIAEFKREELSDLLLRAGAVYPDEKIPAALKKFPKKELADRRIRLIFKTATLEPDPNHADKN